MYVLMYSAAIIPFDRTQLSLLSRVTATATADLPCRILVPCLQLVLEALPTEDITPVFIVIPHRGLLAHIALQGGGELVGSVAWYVRRSITKQGPRVERV